MSQGTFRSGILHCVLIACLTLPVHGLTAEPKALKLVDFSQRLTKDVPVSGRLLVGAVIAPEGSTSVQPLLLLRGEQGPKSNQTLCVSFASRDGVYYGEGRLHADSLRSITAPVRLEADIDAQALRVLNELPVTDLAMLATSGNCGVSSAEERVVHLLDRRASTAPKAELRLMLNASRYTLTVEAKDDKGEPMAVTCLTLDDAKRNKAYNTECLLPLPPRDGAATLTIYRRVYERHFDPVDVKLSWAAP